MLGISFIINGNLYLATIFDINRTRKPSYYADEESIVVLLLGK